jgi:hypothetical protein
MIANFFRSLDEHNVAYLLISGQATVLYGAASFSEDIDLWLKPTEENCARFLSALQRCRARYYKLTPKMTVQNLTRGHGFHFVLPLDDVDVFLDIMGQPPRVGEFSSSFEKVRWMTSEWGRLPTVALKDLVEIKKTQRIEDYPVVSKLALRWFDQPECIVSPSEFEWATNNIFTTDALRTLFEEHPGANAIGQSEASPMRAFATDAASGNPIPPDVENEVSRWLQERMLSHQQADRAYWRSIVAELRQLRAEGELVAEGKPV